jgi:hypothetical protein
LPLPGETEEARRKVAERSIKIGKITTAAKEAAIAAGLADNQAALIAVAEEPTAPEQVKKVAALVSRKRKKHKPRGATGSKALKSPEGKKTFRSSDEETKKLAAEFGKNGHRISPDDFVLAPSADTSVARPSEYGVVRIPNSHPNRDELKKSIRSLAEDYHTEVFFKVFPEDGPPDIDDDAEEAEAEHE